MPSSQLPGYHAHPSLPIQIAWDGQDGQSTPVAGSHTEVTVGKKEVEKHDPGEIPPAGLLLWNSLLVALIMVVFALVARRRMEDVPKKLQNFAELIVEMLDRMTRDTIGPGGEKYTPLIGTVFLYILLMNLIGLIPGFHSPTSNLTFTLAMGVVVFLYVQYEGIRRNGIIGYIKHFMGPVPLLSPLMLPVELISEFVKPFTLAIRLFGNIFGEDVILIVLAGLGAGSVATMWLPIHFPVLLLAILTSVVQAGVFAILVCVYLSLMAPHDHEEEHHDEGPTQSMAHAHETSP